MQDILYFSVALIASIVGSLCGIGGGVIIKPVMDAVGTLSGEVIHFLSGCTVLAMTVVSVGAAAVKKEIHVDSKTTAPLAVSAVAGGLIGKGLFQWGIDNASKPGYLEIVQAVLLIILTIGTLLYSLNRKAISPKKILNIGGVITIGFILGTVSSFLGIGGGPFNLVVLYIFFGMSTKEAVQNSLYIILFSQLTSLIVSLVSRSVPDFPLQLLVLMVFGGIVGAAIGRVMNKKIDENQVERLFVFLLIVIIILNIYVVFNALV